MILIKEFYNYILERERIWERRFILHLPQEEWTADLILKQYKFCNTRRERDNGTIWYMKNIGQFFHKVSDEFLLWQTIIYRIINNPSFFEWAGFPYMKEDSITAYMLAVREWTHEGKKLRSDAYLIHLPTKFGKTFIAQFEGVLKSMLINVPILYKAFERDGRRGVLDPEMTWRWLQQLDGVGKFVAYEIWCDLVLAGFLPFTEDDFVNIGPGAIPALEMLFPDYCVNEDTKLLINKLQDIQYDYLPKDFKRLTLRSIEHNLCEFRKYMNLKEGNIHVKKRYYNPTAYA